MICIHIAKNRVKNQGVKPLDIGILTKLSTKSGSICQDFMTLTNEI